MNNPFTHTRAALAKYEMGAALRQAFWEVAEFESSADVHRLEAADKAALDEVRAAFYQDTKDVNSVGDCMLVDIGFMRKCAERAIKEGL